MTLKAGAADVEEDFTELYGRAEEQSTLESLMETIIGHMQKVKETSSWRAKFSACILIGKKASGRSPSS